MIDNNIEKENGQINTDENHLQNIKAEEDVKKEASFEKVNVGETAEKEETAPTEETVSEAAEEEKKAEEKETDNKTEAETENTEVEALSEDDGKTVSAEEKAEEEKKEDGEAVVEDEDSDVKTSRNNSGITVHIVEKRPKPVRIVEEEDDEEEETVKRPVKKNDDGGFLRGLFEIMEMVCIAIGVVVLIVTFLFRFSKVDGESMTYTINENDTLLVSMAFYKPERGDVIIYQAPGYDINKPLVKRIIAIEGDAIEINFDKWEVKVNGKVIEEDYVRYHPYLPDNEDDKYVSLHPDYDMAHQTVGDIPEGDYDPINKIFKAVVPEGHIFTMGDNRNNSHDSRSADIGMVDERFIVGKVVARIFPLDSIGIID